MTDLETAVAEIRDDLIDFARNLVRIESYSGREEAAVRYVESTMHELGYDEVSVDGMGNVLGRIGSGDRSVLFDSHLDTVEVADEAAWSVPPFEGAVVDGELRGRGSVDMKSAAAASIFAAVVARRMGWTEDATAYVSGTVMEEDCDGENLAFLFQETGLRPEAVVICEPSKNRIALGHRGKAQIVIRTRGVSAHGAAPEKGKNAVYEMAEIVQRVEALNTALARDVEQRGTVVLSRISSVSASMNAVPSECEIYLDRRLVPGENQETVRREMDVLVEGKDAEWEVGTLHRTSWTGHPVEYRPLHPAWELDPDHPLARSCSRAHEAAFGRPPDEHVFWEFSTNGVTPVALGIPTVGFGPGDPARAHMRDEACPVDETVDACRFYAALIRETAAGSGDGVGDG